MSDTQHNAELNHRIQAHLEAGRLNEARDLLIQYCRINSDDAIALSMLGQLHCQFNELEPAVNCLEKSVSLEPGHTSVLMQLVGCLKRLGRLEEAARHCRAALEINPDPVQFWWELGDLSAQLEDFPVVERCCRAVLDRDSAISAARLYLGVSLQRQGRLREAEEVLRAVVADAPAVPDAHFNLGLVLQAQDDAIGALQCFRSAHDFGMESGALLHNMGLLHYQQGNPADALDCSFRALQREPGTLKYRQFFVRALRACTPRRVTGEMMAEILRCFNCTGIDSMYLMKPGMTLLMQCPQAQQLVEEALIGGYGRIEAQLAAGEYDALLRDRLLHSLLLHTRIASPEFELVLRILRRLALANVLHTHDVAESVIFAEDAACAVALAGQFFNTEYAAFVDPHEADQVALLDEALHANCSDIDNNILLNWIAVMCMYRPLYSMPELGRQVGDRLTHSENPSGFLIRTQWQEPLAEETHRQGLNRLTTVTDATSQAVREQYEQSPYPRWETVTLQEPVGTAGLISDMCPGSVPLGIDEDTPQILIAGCGTGLHAVMSATQYGDAAVLAVDLSARSLAYAMRKAQELGISNLHFAQADILELGAVGKEFHIIESVGVLHHMHNPEVGLRVLTGLLPVNGLIRLGLYSRAGRRDVAAARRLIAAKGYEATPDGIRQARRDIMRLPDDQLERRVTRFRDFYSLSGCRDLLFHVQEWRFDLTEVAGLLGRVGLRFCGFENDDTGLKSAYLRQHPDDPGMLNLANWRVFEEKYPDAFSEMYQFWCQKV